MRVRFVSPSRVVAEVGVMVTVVVLWLICTSSAARQWTATAVPKVSVESGGSLSIVIGTVNGNQIDFGELGSGTPQEKTLTLSVTANNSWGLTVIKSQDFKCDNPSDPGYGQSIPSSNFTYSSNEPVGPTYTSTSTEFGTNTSPSNVVINGSAVGDSNINVVYRLVIPASQLTGY